MQGPVRSAGKGPDASGVGEWFRGELQRITGGNDGRGRRGPEHLLPFFDWALSVPEPKTGRLDFERFPYQRELYADGADLRSITVMKSTQVGASAWLLRWALYWPDVLGLTALYLFPADRQMSDFSQHRIAPLLRGEYLSSRVTSSQINNVHQRQIGEGWLYLRGAQAEAGLESVDADTLAFDEYDLIPAMNISVAERRLSSPLSKGLIRGVGWPSVDGFGIAKLYEESDRRRWFVKCNACKAQQFLRFFPRGGEGEAGDSLPAALAGYVDATTATLRCGKCDKELSPEMVAGGQWVAEFPDRPDRGYHIHHLLVPGADLRRLITASQRSNPWQKQLFFNRDLGEPYSPEEGRLSFEAIQAAQSRGGYAQGPRDLGYSGSKLVTMGVDVASTRSLHVRISEHLNDTEKIALFIGEVDSFDDLSALMDMYRVHMCAVDHLPEGRLAWGFAERYAGRVYLVNLAGGGQQDVLKVDVERRHASVRRTEAMDATGHLIRAQLNLLPDDLPADYVEHMRAPVRFVEKDDMGRVLVGYRSTGPDDYFMAELFDLVATELYWHRVVLDWMTREEITTLHDYLGSERSSLHDPFDAEDRLGPAYTGSLGPSERPEYDDW